MPRGQATRVGSFLSEDLPVIKAVSYFMGLHLLANLLSHPARHVVQEIFDDTPTKSHFGLFADNITIAGG